MLVMVLKTLNLFLFRSLFLVQEPMTKTQPMTGFSYIVQDCCDTITFISRIMTYIPSVWKFSFLWMDVAKASLVISYPVGFFLIS